MATTTRPISGSQKPDVVLAVKWGRWPQVFGSARSRFWQAAFRAVR